VTTRNDPYPYEVLRAVLDEPEMRALRADQGKPIGAWQVIGAIEHFNRLMRLPSIVKGADERATSAMRGMIDAYDRAHPYDYYRGT
jgi:hypothetical protein